MTPIGAGLSPGPSMRKIAGGARMELPAPKRKATVDPTNDVVQYEATGCSGRIHALGTESIEKGKEHKSYNEYELYKQSQSMISYSAQYHIPRHMHTALKPRVYTIRKRTMARLMVTLPSETVPSCIKINLGNHAPDQSTTMPKNNNPNPIKYVRRALFNRKFQYVPSPYGGISSMAGIRKQNESPPTREASGG